MPTNVDFKDVTALLPLLTGILTYFKTSHERLKRARRLAKSYGLGVIYSAANIWPHWLYIIATLLVMMSSIGHIAVKFFSGTTSLPYVGGLLGWISANYYVIFVAWLVFVGLAYFQVIEWLVLRGFGVFGGTRKTVAWANAYWHIREDSADAPTLAPSEAGLTKMANAIVGDLVTQPRNVNLALRPPGLENEDAANVLYFGHVIEEYATSVGGAQFRWTAFYEALGKVANSAVRPFSSKALARFESGKQSFLNEVLLKMNDHVGPDFPKLTNDAELEQRVTTALGVLQQEFRSDARNVAKGWVRFSYNAILANSKSVFSREEIRRQFAKLVMLWNVVPKLHRPDVFHVPFSGGIFLLYLNKEVLRAGGDEFERDDSCVHICFGCTQKRLMRAVLILIDRSVDPARTAWRDTEKQAIATRGADWKTWIYYRADQHSYHLGRAAERTPWKEANNGDTFVKS